jgi:hypothetical protein
MFWLSYERWDFADFGGFWYKSGGRTTGVGVQAGNRVSCKTGMGVFRVGLVLSVKRKSGLRRPCLPLASPLSRAQSTTFLC